jgi:carbonic anhydrase
MRKLIDGIVEFRNHVLPSYRKTFGRLATEQKPDALFIACCDSRVVPNLFASTDPGDLFVIRNVGNFVPPAHSAGSVSEGAAIEYSIQALNVRDVIVCGHSECGATKALLTPPMYHAPHLAQWLRFGEDVVAKFRMGFAPDKSLLPHDQISQLNTLVQIENLKTYASIRSRWEQGSLRFHAWWFDIRTADVYAYEPDREKFVVIDEKTAKRILLRLQKEEGLGRPSMVL